MVHPVTPKLYARVQWHQYLALLLQYCCCIIYYKTSFIGAVCILYMNVS